MDFKRIRNFCIIAHIDHGKSTLADRILEVTGAVHPRDAKAQLLDSMELERERGITIKAQAVRVTYQAQDEETYRLHLIDTPGHVDFNYEVSRALAACEGALLVVDASQGIEAQTLANTYLAVEAGLEVIPVLNKIDLPSAEPERVSAEIIDLLGPSDILQVSAKTGKGIEELMEAIVKRVPPPTGSLRAAPRALIFDSEFDQYRGVVAYVRMVDGTLKKGDPILTMQKKTKADIDEIGYFSPPMTPTPNLSAGEVGYVITGIKKVSELQVGDTLTLQRDGAGEALPGYQEAKPMVFCGLFPVDSSQFPELRDALEKLSLNDASFTYEPESSEALGFGFRCGFLGLLHMDIIKERIEREYEIPMLATAPNVQYQVTTTDHKEHIIHAPSQMPERSRIQEIKEPYIEASIVTPKEYLGQVIELCQGRRGSQTGMHYLSAERVQIQYRIPLGEIVLDFFDQLKSRTRGYASLDYELIGYQTSNLVKLDILLAGEPVDALSLIVHQDRAQSTGRLLVEKLKEEIPRQQFEVPVQAAIGTQVVARETVKAYRKSVTEGLYGGDVTRKNKLLEKQKKGKARMKKIGKVDLPQEAFLSILKINEE